MALNDFVVINELDIFKEVGFATAHDVAVEFSIRGDQLSLNHDVRPYNGELLVKFMTVSDPDYPQLFIDNPKINAMYIMRGTLADVVNLPPLIVDYDGFDSAGDIESEPAPQFNYNSGNIGVSNPYGGGSWMVLVGTVLIVVLSAFFLVRRM